MSTEFEWERETGFSSKCNDIAIKSNVEFGQEKGSVLRHALNNSECKQKSVVCVFSRSISFLEREKNVHWSGADRKKCFQP